MLTSTGLGDETGLAEALGKKRLSQHIVDLVGTGVIEVFALQEDSRATGECSETRRFGDDGGSARVRAMQLGKFCLEDRVGLGGGVRDVELIEGCNERLRHETTAVFAKVRA